jgi:hypothetical protein
VLKFIEICNEDNYFVKSVNIVEEILRAFRIGEDASVYKGQYESSDVLYMFFELPQNSVDSHLLYMQNDLWFVCIDEIFNSQVILKDIVIDEDVKSFFFFEPEFGVLCDENGTYFETPMVVYYDCERSKSLYYSTFGVPLNENKTYSLTNCGLSSSAVIRVAVFLGNMHYFGDEKDENIAYNSFFELKGDNEYLIQIVEHDQQVPLTFHYVKNNNIV